MALATSAKCDLVLMGGQIGSGKSAIAERVATVTADCGLLRVRVVLADVLGISASDRQSLQVNGRALDRRTGGRWLLHYIEEHCEIIHHWVVDAARTPRQVEPILERRLGSRLVYLAASEETRRRRFALGATSDPVKRSMPFDQAMRHETEAEAQTIASMAHLVVETDDLGIDEIVETIVDWCGWKG